jgi:polyphenol oxidase
MEQFHVIAALDPSQRTNHLFGTRWVDSPGIIAKCLGVDEERTVTVHQVHGNAIRIVESLNTNESSQEVGHDALITCQPGLLIAIATADCVPVLIVDTVQGVVAAVHAGWRSTLKRITTEVVTAMNSHFGSQARNLQVGLGPAAGPCCYEVGEAVLGPIQAEFPMWQSVIREQDNGKALLDLHSLNRLQLIEAGVPLRQIHAVDTCTVCCPGPFYSYRREGRETGRMFSGIVVKGL